MSKYQPLYDYLISQDKNSLDVSFAKLEKLLGFKLPKSAYQYQAWWANDGTHYQALTWLSSGWITEQINLSGKRVRFVRSGKLAKLKSGRTQKDSPTITDQPFKWDSNENINYH